MTKIKRSVVVTFKENITIECMLFITSINIAIEIKLMTDLNIEIINDRVNMILKKDRFEASIDL